MVTGHPGHNGQHVHVLVVEEKKQGPEHVQIQNQNTVAKHVQVELQRPKDVMKIVVLQVI